MYGGAFALLLAVAQASQSAPVEGSLPEARSLLRQGKLAEAEQIVRRNLASQPSADAHFLLGYILFRQIQSTASVEGSGAGDSEAVREQARASLAEYAKGARYRDPGAFDLKIAALDQILLKGYDPAVKLLTESVAADPKDPQAWYYLGRTKNNQNRFGEAITAFEECLKLEPRNVKAQDNLGLSYAGLGRVREATAAFKTAIEWQAAAPAKNPWPFLNLGNILLEQNQPREALPYLLEAAALSPRELKAREKLGKAYLQLDELDKAVTELEAAVALDPENAPTRYILGQAYRRKGWIEKAKAEFDRVAALNAKRRG